MWAKNAIKKTWMKANAPIKRHTNTVRHNSVTLYGAVSNFTKEIIITMDKSTNTDGFIDFLRTIREYHDSRHMTDKIYLVLDNHSVHYANLVKKEY